MRLALLADIHGNYVALESVLQELAQESVEQIICLGDVGALGPQPHETIDRLRGAVLSLPANYREVVILCDLHEMGYTEAAGILGCAVGTVRSRLHRARALLVSKLRSARHVAVDAGSERASAL